MVVPTNNTDMIRFFTSILIFSLVLCSAIGFAQDVPDNLPTNAIPGKCYGQVYTPAEYEYKETTVIDKPASTRKVVIPPIYEIVYDTIVVQEAQKKLIVIPAAYETVVESVLVAPAATKWVKMRADPTCLSKNPEDCQVLVLKEVPAEYKTFSRRVLKTPAFTQEKNIPRELKITARKVVKTPEQIKEVPVPPTYKTEMKRIVSKAGAYSAWEQVVCNKDLTYEFIAKVQEALNAKGYKVGIADGVMGNQTEQAMLKFQSDNNLPMGNLNVKTLKALGITYS